MRTELCLSKAYHPQIDAHLKFVYGDNLSSVLDLTPISHAGKFNKYHVGEYNKLNNRKIGPCEILKQINDNAYKLKLPSHIQTSDVFNVKHVGNGYSDEELNSKTSSLQPGEDDAVEIIPLDYLE
ncbi:hypothetical protein AMTRI_Chr04g182080 [Amborella trichopoda]